ncbi:MAG TPA: aminotransferase class III-fold pyridoxal phosphate-dependent enzyme [Gallionellaceae bacterium]|jgi:glutamate-1-semialdehyde 2,1-aminomutase|nr:aminotransferase class III-fold pyridoxal phosphate-dependent enzyme [Gallionellaceae bacterium]HQS73952.1 aminotransferase class III-fold pyridoxal phosphate-dependent enzyme [Gallionellaceae bacterium]
MMNETISLDDLALYGAGGLLLLSGLRRVKNRVELSLAKHGSLAGHPRNARRLASFLPDYSYDEAHAFGVDGAPEEITARRRIAFAALVAEFQSRYAQSLLATADVVSGLSDLQFISAYRVPFQFRRLADKGLKIASFVQSTAGVKVTDLDGNQFFDLTGSYGVNLFGYDFYKDCIDQGADMVRQLGPVLGSYHPVVADNVIRLKKISGMDEVSFHMSGTEAVMQAVRLARYHSGRSKVLRFCGSYHGWWGDVQPGIGNPVTEKDTFTLAEMSDATLRVLRNRNDIACVLVNPLQALHPNVAAPGDSSLLDSSRKAGFSREAYTGWLQALRKICDEKNIALIFDEVFVGFRLAPGGAQEYFGVRADMVTYGKTLGGGLPIGVVCGKAGWMKRYRADAPGDICFARGTFNSHPYVMGAMNAFLQRLDSSEIRTLYADLDAGWNRRAQDLNRKLQEAGIPVQVANLSSIWTVVYTQPACYNWLFQFYLRLEGLALSWVGTGRIIFSLNFTEEDFNNVSSCFVRAAQNMQRDGWWWNNPAMSNKSIKRRILREMLKAKFQRAG